MLVLISIATVLLSAMLVATVVFSKDLTSDAGLASPDIRTIALLWIPAVPYSIPSVGEYHTGTLLTKLSISLTMPTQKERFDTRLPQRSNTYLSWLRTSSCYQCKRFQQHRRQ